VAGQQDRIGQEMREFAEIARTPVRQVLVSLRGDARGNAGQGHQGCVRDHLAAEHDKRARMAAQRGETFRPRLLAAEQADDDHVGAVQQRRQVGRRQARRVGQPVVRAARTRGKQVGVGSRQQ